ncbi:MAG TPA: LuxR C-terminal-related transcriptional regulator [Pirellulales bacterium]
MCAANGAGQPLFNPDEWSQIVRALGLSPRKAQIVALILEDLKDDAIASALNLTKPTIRSHIGQMFRRFRVPSRLGLAVTVFLTFRQVVEQDGHHQK